MNTSYRSARNSLSDIPTSKTENAGIMRVRTLRDSLHSIEDGRDCDRPSDKSSSPSVRFNQITIREYAIVIGDNPSCSSGAPLR